MSFAVYKTNFRRQPFTYHPAIGWWHLPNFYARLALGQTWHNFQTNSLGIRENKEFSTVKSSQQRRIAFLGDSYTAGDGVDNDQRFSNVVKNFIPANIETLNFGLNSSGTDQQLIIFEQIAKNFNADAYVWGICVENIIRNLCNCRPSWDFAEHQTVYRPKPFFSLPQGSLQASDQPVERQTIRVEDVGKEWISFPQSYIKTTSIYDLYSEPEAYPWQLMKAILEHMIWRAEGKPVFLMPLPMVDHYLDGMPPHYIERFSAFHQPQNNVFVVDVLPSFLDKPKALRKLYRFPDDPHYTHYAHTQVAEVLAYNIQYYTPDIFYQDYLV